MLQTCKMAWNASLPLMQTKIGRQILLQPFSEMLEDIMALAGRRRGLDALKGEVSYYFVAVPPRRNSLPPPPPPPSFKQEDETDSGGSAPLLMGSSDQQLFSDMFQLVFQVYLDSVWDKQCL